MTQSICRDWIHLAELVTLNTCDTINMYRLNSLAKTIYTKNLWHNQYVEDEFTWTNCLHKTLVTWSMCWGWIHLDELFTLNTCETVNVWRLNSLVRTVYTKHLRQINVWKFNSLAQTIYTKHLWHDQFVEVEFTCMICLH